MECVTTKDLGMNMIRKENSKRRTMCEISSLSPGLDMNIVGKEISKGRTIWDISPLSPPWTTAVVFVLIILFTVIMKISLSS